MSVDWFVCVAGLQRLLEQKDNHVFKGLAKLAAFGCTYKDAVAGANAVPAVLWRLGSAMSGLGGCILRLPGRASLPCCPLCCTSTPGSMSACPACVPCLPCLPALPACPACLPCLPACSWQRCDAARGL